MVATAKMKAAGEPTAVALPLANLVNQLAEVALRELDMSYGMSLATLQVGSGQITAKTGGKLKVMPVTNAGDPPHCGLAVPGATMLTGPR